MLSGRFTRKIFIASLLYFMLGKYSLILSNFKCFHKKGKVDETRRYNFRLFQVFFSSFFFFFFYFLFFIFSPVLLPKAKYNRKGNISRWLLISALTINQTDTLLCSIISKNVLSKKKEKVSEKSNRYIWFDVFE